MFYVSAFVKWKSIMKGKSLFITWWSTVVYSFILVDLFFSLDYDYFFLDKLVHVMSTQFKNQMDAQILISCMLVFQFCCYACLLILSFIY